MLTLPDNCTGRRVYILLRKIMHATSRMRPDWLGFNLFLRPPLVTELSYSSKKIRGTLPPDQQPCCHYH